MKHHSQDLKRKIHPTHSSKVLCKRYPVKYCVKCGLLYLRNKVTDIAMGSVCPDKDD